MHTCLHGHGLLTIVQLACDEAAERAIITYQSLTSAIRQPRIIVLCQSRLAAEAGHIALFTWPGLNVTCRRYVPPRVFTGQAPTKF